MHRYNIIICVSILLTSMFSTHLYAQNHLEGTVYDKSTGLPLVGVNIVDELSGHKATSDSLGRFSISTPQNEVSLLFSRIGHKTLSRRYAISESPIRVFLHPSILEIDEVEINTGYQWVPRERATGSFVHVGKEEFEMIPGQSVIERLDGIMPGLQFDKRMSGVTSTGSPIITVRGMTKFSAVGSAPLIVVDNFPFEGELESINPDDVESVTMLRDAAATSIWGARAGNGVLVINMKKSDKSGRTSVGWSSSIVKSGKPDLYYQPTMSSSDFVDVELFLYEKNFYRSGLTGASAHLLVFSPVVQATYDAEMGIITQDELQMIIANARDHDYRDDLLAHYYTNSFNQRNHFSISKSSGSNSMRLAAGFDQNFAKSNFAIGIQKDQRYSVSMYNQYHLLDQLSVSLSVNYSLVDNPSVGGLHYPFNPQGGKTVLYPYAKLVDEHGQYLSAPQGLNVNFVDTVGGGNLLDWRYIPFEEPVNNVRNTRIQNINPTFTLNYNPFRTFNLGFTYNGEFQSTRDENRHGIHSYNVRNNVNRFTQISGEQIFQNFPYGDIYTLEHANFVGNKARLTAKMDEALFGDDHFTWIFGGEISDVKIRNSSQRVYGYNDFISSSVPVDHLYRYPLFLGGSGVIPYLHSFSRGVRRLASVFANASYTYNSKYIVSASMRRDASNTFGVKANERWNPLWSMGAAWNVHRENFLNDISWLSNLRLRISHGQSGNLGGGTTSDRPILHHSILTAMIPHLPYASITSPANTSLKWENMRMTNFGLEFGFWKGRIVGGAEYYIKKITDLISVDLLDPTTGYNSMNRNVAEIDGEGFEITLSVNPLKGGVNWVVHNSMSYTNDWTTKYHGNLVNASTLVSSDNTVRPLIGKSMVPVHSYRFAGLDPTNGEPLGVFNGEISNNYQGISRDSIHNLIYHGSARPKFYGFMNHTIRYRGFALFINIAYRAGHYFKRSTVNYNSMFSSWNTHSDYSKRWQKSGDELITTVPAMVYPANLNRDTFYGNSEVNVEKGDVIRLQQVRANYSKNFKSSMIRKINFGITMGDLGVIWKATKDDRDPDYLSIPPAKTISASINIQF